MARQQQDPDLDIVVIPTPNHTHAPLAEAALRAGKHVVVDKPFALDTSEADRLVSLARDTGRVLSVFHNGDGTGTSSRCATSSAPGGSGARSSLHPISTGSGPLCATVGASNRPRRRHLVRFGPAPGRPSSSTLRPTPHRLRRPCSSVRWWKGDDYAHVVLGYDRLRVVLHATMLAAAEPPRFLLHGTAGSFVIHGLDPQEEALKAGKRPGEAVWGLGAPDGILVTPEGEQSVPRQPGHSWTPPGAAAKPGTGWKWRRDDGRRRREPGTGPQPSGQTGAPPSARSVRADGGLGTRHPASR
ncbi:MAG: Gfo/Idh/MocA family oxidoreductase, partial [Acetobacteraceae bacterium]|nr:Gfo/Idh/MocA family oxidoreductase [Acetobacteraceae bacterium]